MFKTIYLSSVVALLLVSGVWHILPSELTERWLRKEIGIRIVGALLLELSAPCIAFGGWHYWVLFVGLTASGFTRFCFPNATFGTLRKSYPILVQSCLILEVATLAWALHS